MAYNPQEQGQGREVSQQGYIPGGGDSLYAQIQREKRMETTVSQAVVPAGASSEKVPSPYVLDTRDHEIRVEEGMKMMFAKAKLAQEAKSFRKGPFTDHFGVSHPDTYKQQAVIGIGIPSERQKTHARQIIITRDSRTNQVLDVSSYEPNTEDTYAQQQQSGFRGSIAIGEMGLLAAALPGTRLESYFFDGNDAYRIAWQPTYNGDQLNRPMRISADTAATLGMLADVLNPLQIPQGEEFLTYNPMRNFNTGVRQAWSNLPMQPRYMPNGGKLGVSARK